MMRRVAIAFAVAMLGQSTVVAAPLVPKIDSHAFNFGAWGGPVSETGTTFYAPRGAEPDYLTLSGGQGDREATAFWEVWPMGGDPLPIFNVEDEFGGNVEMYLQFDEEDSASSPLDISIVGSGRSDGADLVISGKMPSLGITTWQTLVEIEVETASLHGYGGGESLVLETVGEFTFVNSALPGSDDLVGMSAVSSGNIHLKKLGLPLAYDPLVDYGFQPADGGYLGDLGQGCPTPEPTTLLTLLVGAGLVLRRRC